MCVLCFSRVAALSWCLAAAWVNAAEHQDVIDAIAMPPAGMDAAAPLAAPVVNHGQWDLRVGVDPGGVSGQAAHQPAPDPLGGAAASAGSAAHSDLAREILSGSKQSLSKLTRAREDGEASEAEALRGKLLVFISLSMPKHALKPLFEQAREREDVVFYLRGWHPPNLTDVVRQVLDMAGSPDYPVPVLIDPYAFKDYDVAHAPVFIKDTPTGLRRIDGEISVTGALEWLDSDKELPSDPVGATHPIAEPDPIEYARAKAQTIDWEQQIADAKRRFLAKPAGVALPEARTDETYHVDLTVRVSEDIEGPSGVIAKAGTVINPLTQVLVRHAYAFFDPARPRQVEVVRGWLAEHRNLVLIATQIAPLSKEREELVRDLGQAVYPLNETLAARFQIDRVPALVVADGALLRVTVTGIPESPSEEAQ